MIKVKISHGENRGFSFYQNSKSDWSIPKIKKTLSGIPWVLYNESNYKLHHRRIFE
jgi:hypothetical protein